MWIAAIADLPAADNGVELDALAGLGHDQQREAVAAVAAGTAKNFRAAAQRLHASGAATEAEPDKGFERLVGAWNGASAAAREHFVDFLGADGFLPAGAHPDPSGGGATAQSDRWVDLSPRPPAVEQNR